MTQTTSDCILWAGRTNVYGYGISHEIRVHRLAWELFHNQEIPEGMHVHHLCEETRCINPEHLLLVTPEMHRKIHAESIPLTYIDEDEPWPYGKMPEAKAYLDSNEKGR